MNTTIRSLKLLACRDVTARLGSRTKKQKNTRNAPRQKKNTTRHKREAIAGGTSHDEKLYKDNNIYTSKYIICTTGVGPALSPLAHDLPRPF